MTEIKLPPLPDYPAVPPFAERGLWNEWAQAFARQAVQEAVAAQRERWGELLEAAREAIDYYPTKSAPGYMTSIREAVEKIDAAIRGATSPPSSR
jgi:hypothetical protein